MEELEGGGGVLLADGFDDLAGALDDDLAVGVDEIAEQGQGEGDEERGVGGVLEALVLAGVAGEPEADAQDDEEAEEPVGGVEEEFAHQSLMWGGGTVR